MDISHRKVFKKVRFNDEQGNPVARKKINVKQINHSFLFGCGAFDFLPYVMKGEEEYKNITDGWLEIFNYATLPFYWGNYEPEEGKPNKEVLMKAARYLMEKGVKVKGHPLCWHTVCADWLMKYDNETILKKQLERIDRENIDGDVYRANIVNTILLSVFWSNPVTGLIFIVPVLSKSGKIVGSELTNDIIQSSLNSNKNLFALYFSPAVSALIIIIISCWMISVLMVFLRYARFRSYRLENFIAISRGVINKSFLMTKTDGITAVTINQSLFMKILNIYSAGIFVIGSNKIKGDRSMIIAPESREKIYSGIYELTGIDPNETESIYAEKHHLWSYIYLPVILFVICLSGFIFSKMLGRLSSVIRVLLTICMFLILWWLVFRCFAYKHSHIALCGKNISICTFEKLTLKTYIIPVEKIQTVEISQNIFQLKKDTCNIKLSLFAEKKSTHKIKQLDRKTAENFLKKSGY